MHDTSATVAPDSAIYARLVQCTFRNLLAMAVELNKGPLGFDPNRGPGRSWEGKELKPLLSQHILSKFSNVDILTLLPKYEDRSRRAKAWVQANPDKARNVKPQAIPMDPPTVANDPAPQPITPPASLATPAPQAEEGATVQRVREIAREEAAALDKAIRSDVNALASIAAEQGGIMQGMAHDIEAIKRAQGLTIIVHNNATGQVNTAKLGRQHKTFARLLARCAVKDKDGNRLNLWIAGPAGSGKTTAAMNVAKALNLPFRFSGAVRDEFKLIGFTDAQGVTVRTSFREIWEHGGVFLKDECDGSDEAALLTLNAALANGYCDFPDGCIKRHPDCVIIAAANTWGNGATHEYVGRTKLDAATMDRFVRIAWDYDQEMELDTCPNKAWAEKVQSYRANARTANVHCVISPRASYVGAALLAAGATEAEVIEELITPGMSADNARKVTGAARW